MGAIWSASSRVTSSLCGEGLGPSPASREHSRNQAKVIQGGSTTLMSAENLPAGGGGCKEGKQVQRVRGRQTPRETVPVKSAEEQGSAPQGAATSDGAGAQAEG